MEEEADETIYDESGREDLVDDAEISPEEEGFMKGYEESADEGEEKIVDPDDPDADDEKDVVE